MYGIFDFTSQFEEDAYAVLKKMAGVVQMYLKNFKHCKQPFLNAKKSTSVVCEGEIYNYLELREELKNKGHILRSNNIIEILSCSSATTQEFQIMILVGL